VDSVERNLKINIMTEVPVGKIIYSIKAANWEMKDLDYVEPFIIKESVRVSAYSKINNDITTSLVEKSYTFHKALASKAVYTTQASSKYSGGGVFGLVDGSFGSENFGDGHWQGFSEQDLDVILTLPEKATITSISVNFLQSVGSWIFMPRSIEYYYSTDGVKFILLNKTIPEPSDSEGGTIIKNFKHEFSATEVTHIRVVAKNIGVCPKGHPGEGLGAWLFVDEIVVE